MTVYAVVDDALLPDFPLGDSLETSIRRDDAKRFVEEVGGDDSDLASYLRIEERELKAGGSNQPLPRNGRRRRRLTEWLRTEGYAAPVRPLR